MADIEHALKERAERELAKQENTETQVEDTQTEEEQTESTETNEEVQQEEDSSLNNDNSSSESEDSISVDDNKPSSGEQEGEESYIETEDDFLNLAEEMFGFDESRKETLAKMLKGEALESKYSDPFVKELDEYIQNGGDAKDFYELKLTDYNEMDDLAVVRKAYQKKYPALSVEAINRRLERTFKLNEDKYDDDEIAEGKDDLAFEAAEARKELNSYKDKLKAPFPERKQSGSSNAPSKEDLEAQEQLKQITQNLNSSLKELDTVSFGDFQYKVPDNIKSKVAEAYKNGKLEVGDDFFTDKGFDAKGYNQVRAILADPKAFVNAVREDMRSQVLKEVKEGRNNSTFTEEKQSPKSTGISRAEAVERLAKQMRGEGMRMKFK